jgi:hypothetical protein
MAYTQTYRVHARSDDHRHGHSVEAASFEDAAVAFVADRQPVGSSDLAVVVTLSVARRGRLKPRRRLGPG